MISFFIDTFKIFILFILFLYALIPFETSLAVMIHSSTLFFIIIYSFYLGNFNIQINIQARILLFIIAIITLIALLISSERDSLIFVFSVLYGLIVGSKITYNDYFKTIFLDALKWLIIFSILLLFLQILFLNISGEIIKFHEIIYPFSQARIVNIKQFDDLYRMGGIYIEPGTYSNMMYLFLILYIIISKKKDSFLLFIGAISLLFSYSIWGITFGTYLILILILEKIKYTSFKKKILILFTIISLIAISTSYISNSPALKYTIQKLNTKNESVDAKKVFFEKYINNFDSFLLLGEGFNPDFYKNLTSPQDSGLFMNLTIIFGIIITLLILLMFFIILYKSYGLSILFASFPIFISKIFYYDPTFWLLFFVVIYSYNYKKNLLDKEKQ